MTRFIRDGGTLRRRIRLWTGWERSPLCRPDDRLEARLCVLLAVVFLLVVPVSAWGAGTAVYRASTQAERSERSNRVLVEARLLADAHQVGFGLGTVPEVPVLARWTAADGTERTGAILVGVTAPAGTVVPIWTDRAGNLVQPPRDRDQTAMRTSAAAIGAAFVAAALLGLVRLLMRRAFDRRRMAAWDDEWSLVASRWTERR